MNQTWENDKKPSFGPDFGRFGPNSGFPKFRTVFRQKARKNYFVTQKCLILLISVNIEIIKSDCAFNVDLKKKKKKN